LLIGSKLSSPSLFVPRWFPDLSSALSGTPRPIVAQPGNRKPRSFGTTKQANHLPQAELQTPAKGPPLGMLLIAASHPCTVPLPRQILPSASFPIFDERYIGVLPQSLLRKQFPSYCAATWRLTTLISAPILFPFWLHQSAVNTSHFLNL
jgi:hypothetical protein